MKVTIETIKADIQSGVCTHIYWSANSPWWTHLKSDVDAATEQGRKAMLAVIDRKIKEATNQGQLKHLENIKKEYETRLENGMIIPLDPTGSPLYMTDNPLDFIKKSEGRPGHFGRHGIKAFLMAHHQNTKVHGLNWNFYNQMLDQLN